MRILKTIIGILASLFALAHLISLVAAITGPRQNQGAFEVSRYAGHILGLCIGLIVAVWCFQRRKLKSK